MVGWSDAPDDWGENVALTRSRHLIDSKLIPRRLPKRVDGGDFVPWRFLDAAQLSLGTLSLLLLASKNEHNNRHL
jgi:hypothetical protein